MHQHAMRPLSISSFHCVFERRMRGPAGALDLAAGERDAQIVRALVALHHFDLGAEEVDQRVGELLFGAACRSRQHGLARQQLLNRGHPGAGRDAQVAMLSSTSPIQVNFAGA